MHELSSGACMLEPCFHQHQRDCQQQKVVGIPMQETIAEFTAHHNLLETRQTARLHDVDHVDGREAYVANEKANGGARTRALDRQHVEISSQPRRNSFRWPFFVASQNTNAIQLWIYTI